MTFFDFVDAHWGEIMDLVKKVLNYLKEVAGKGDAE